MAIWLDATIRGNDVFVNVAQFTVAQPKGRLWCRQCQKQVASFTPAALQSRYRADKTNVVPQRDIALRSFCSECGWMYRKLPIPANLRSRVAYKDHHRCVYCGERHAKEDMACDHLIPEIEGGETTVENLVYCCTFCNSSKGRSQDKMVPRFGRFSKETHD